MILVAGGTGRLGTLLARRLAAQDLQVRVLTRDPARAAHLRDARIDVATGDVRTPATLTAAMHGVTAVVSAVHGFGGPGRVTPESVDQKGNANLIKAAVAEGADVVLLSVVGASSTHPMELFRAKFAAEEYLRSSAACWTIVRCTAFRELWADIMAKPIVFGRGENPINFVSVETVVVAVERAVLDPALRGQTLEVGGPTNLTFNQLCAEFQAARGNVATIRHVPRGILRLISPLSRRAAAAVAMDTIDMTFTPALAGLLPESAG